MPIIPEIDINNVTAPILTPDEMGCELIFKISRDELAEFRNLLNKGANANFCDENTGNTPLHFLYYYANCNVRYLESLLEKAAKITANKAGFLPIQMAKEKCNATEFQKIKEIFDRDTSRDISTPFNLTNPNQIKPAGIPYDQQKWAITIGMPILALSNGILAGGWQELAQRYKERPYLPNVIFYALQPISLALTGAVMNSLVVGNAAAVGIEDACLSVMFYVGINYLGLMFAQLGENFTKKFQNKVLNLLIPILLYTFYLNPSLIINLLSEGFKGVGFQAEMLPLLSTLSNGILFKTGEFGTKKLMNKFFPVNCEDSVNPTRDYFLRSSSNGASIEISVVEKTIQKIEELLHVFKNTLNKQISSEASALIDKKIKLAEGNLLKLYDKENHEVVRDTFNAFEENLKDIRGDLDVLKKLPKVKPHIICLYDQVNKIFPYISKIRPLPEFSPVDMSANREECIPLRNSNINNKSHDSNGIPHYQRPSSVLRRVTLYFANPRASSKIKLESMMEDHPQQNVGPNA